MNNATNNPSHIDPSYVLVKNKLKMTTVLSLCNILDMKIF